MPHIVRNEPSRTEWKVSEIRMLLWQMQQNKFDGIICIDGSRGLGKSTLAYKIAMGFPQFKAERDIVYSKEDVLRNVATQKFGIIFADEMINAAFKRDFYDALQKDLIKTLNMYRDSCNIVLMCIPNFHDLDRALKSLVKMRITVLYRGTALIQVPLKRIHTDDPWDSKYNMKIEQEWIERGLVDYRYNRLSTYAGILHYGDLQPLQREKYERIKASKRNQLILSGSLDIGGTGPISRDEFLENLLRMLKSGLLSRDELTKICTINNRSFKTVSSNINELLKSENSKMRLKDLLALNKHTTTGYKLSQVNLQERKSLVLTNEG